MSERKRSTPQEQIEEMKDVARIMGNPPSAIIFYQDGSVKTFINFPPPFSQDSVTPKSQSEITISNQRDSQNLSGLNGLHNGKYYVNGQPMERKNGNGRH